MEKCMRWRVTGRSFAGLSWLFQRFSAAALLGLLLLHAHYSTRSFISSGTMTYGDLMTVFSKPAVKATEICFFFFGALHFINGIRSVAAIFFRSPVLRGWIAAAVAIAGVSFFCIVSIAILSL